MIIILLMLIFSFILIRKKIEDKLLRKKITYVYVIALFFQLVLFIIYRYELNSLNMDVYYSDATDYWNATLSILNGRTTSQYNSVYYLTCVVVQRLSPFIWVGWNNLFNIMCVNVSIIMLSISLCRGFITSSFNKNSSDKQVLMFSVLNFFNPLIYYSLMRNLKDAEFLLLVTLVAYDYYSFSLNKENKNMFLYFLRLLVLSVLLFGIRPWGFVVGFIPILLMFFKSNNNKAKKKMSIVAIVLALGMGFLLFDKIKSTLNIWIPVVLSSASSRGILQTIFGIVKLILGPGPIRSLFGEVYFVFYTISGNYMCMVGSLIWWFEFFILLFPCIRNLLIKEKKSLLNLFLLLFMGIYILIYVLQYGGSTEIRFRGVLYILFSAYFCSSGILKFKRQDLIASNLIVIIMFCANLLAII